MAFAVAKATDIEMLAQLNQPIEVQEAFQQIECNCTNKCAPERVRGPKPFEICIDYCQKLIEADMKYQQDLHDGHSTPETASLHQKIRMNIEMLGQTQ